MSLFVEFHLIQNFAPSNLNRDDTGAPKDALFGGHRRARVSSQCFKRSIRNWFSTSDLIAKESLGVRTRHLDRLLTDELRSIGIEDFSKFNEIVKIAIKKKDRGGADTGSDDGSETNVLSYLVFISATEIDAFRELVAQHAKEITTLVGKKKIKQSDLSDQFKSDIRKCLFKSNAVDVSLFGRMLADLPEVNRDAACQVAHAISTHRVEREFDYFTAVDDKGGPDETGAGMIGQVEFNSATLYRYAVVDAGKLLENLQQDRDLTTSALAAFTQAMVRAVPSGKQNSFAAHNAPSFVGVSLRQGAPLNLANAFEKPVTASLNAALTEQSVAALGNHEAQLAAVYGDSRDAWAFLDLTGQWPAERGQRQDNLGQLAAWVAEQAGRHLGN